MSFHSPFDEVQWKLARLDHAKMRAHFRQVSVEYPPRTPDEIDVLRAYNRYVRKFGSELSKSMSKIDPARLNELSAKVSVSFTAYYSLYIRRN
jgi:hypothetical protein